MKASLTGLNLGEQNKQSSYHEADAAPSQDSDGGSHGKAKLDEVSGIIVTLDGGYHGWLVRGWRELLTSGHSVVQGGVSSPGHPVVCGEGARPLGLVEQQGEVQHLAVGVGRGVVGLVALVGVMGQYSHNTLCPLRSEKKSEFIIQID